MSIERILSSTPVIPVLTIRRREDAVPLVRALVAGGLKVVEITLRTDVALDAIRAVAAEAPDAVVGAGTVLDADGLASAYAAGARFAVSPGATPELLRAAAGGDLPLLPGVATASEMMAAAEAGYTYLKFYPAEAMGGAVALKLFGGPFPTLRFCPTGGISPANAASYLALPNVVCVGGSWLAPEDAVAAGDWPRVTALAREAAALRG